MNLRNDIWVVDDDEAIRYVLQRALRRRGYDVACFENVGDVRAALQSGHPRALLTDIRLPDEDGLSVVDTLEEKAIDIPVIAMTAYADLDQAVSAFRKGVFEYLPKPFDLEQVMSVVERAIASEQVVDHEPEEQGRNRLLGESQAMQEVFRTIGRLSRSDISVLITGETGSGKEVVARVLHENSPRSRGPFVAINTAAIPAELLESELFGHEKGSFTGAHSRRVGRFEEAAGGTLFLDEIGDMPLALQVKLLRALQERRIRPIGGTDSEPIDVRIISATNRDLERDMQEGTFREDLFYRICEMEIEIPPLRQRQGDKLVLARHFLKNFTENANENIQGFTPEAVEAIEAYDWPGNIREMENRIKRSVVMCDDKLISSEDLGLVAEGNLSLNLREVRYNAERAAILRALTMTEYNISATSKLLGVTRPTLYDLMKKYNIPAANT
jgi:two-component system NtrC family response regulator